MTVELLQEIGYQCPHCWEPNTTLIDLSGTDDVLIEDCRVCCRPARLEVSVTAGGIAEVAALPTE